MTKDPPPQIAVSAASCTDNGNGICTSCTTVHEIPRYQLELGPAEPVGPFHYWCDWCDADLGVSDEHDKERAREHALVCERNPLLLEVRRLRSTIAELRESLEAAEEQARSCASSTCAS